MLRSCLPDLSPSMLCRQRRTSKVLCCSRSQGDRANRVLRRLLYQVVSEDHSFSKGNKTNVTVHSESNSKVCITKRCLCWQCYATTEGGRSIARAGERYECYLGLPYMWSLKSRAEQLRPFDSESAYSIAAMPGLRYQATALFAYQSHDCVHVEQGSWLSTALFIFESQLRWSGQSCSK